MEHIAYMDTPIGTLEIKGDTEAVTSILFVEEGPATENIPDTLRSCVDQLHEYFDGKRKDFDFPFEARGSQFQKTVWAGLLKIPFGKTTSYGELANTLNNPKAVRAVGTANGKNPLTIVIPCHRVLGADGSLTGFGAGMHRKEWLLKHEGATSQLNLF